MMPSWPSRSSGLTWETTSGMVGLHPPRGRVVDDRGAMGDRRRGELGRDVGAGGEERDIDAFEGIGDGLGDLERPTLDRDAFVRPSGPRRAGAAHRPGTPVR